MELEQKRVFLASENSMCFDQKLEWKDELIQGFNIFKEMKELMKVNILNDKIDGNEHVHYTKIIISCKF